MDRYAARSAGMTLLRRVRDAFGGTAVVLAYHRVADLDSDPLQLAVSPGLFEEQVAILARDHYLMTAGALLKHLAERRRIPDQAVVITLDDGYADAFTSAKPILERHGAAATIFVTTGPFERGEAFWWDEAERLTLHADAPAGHLVLAVGDARLNVVFGGSSEGMIARDGRVTGWNVTVPAESPHHQLFLDVIAFLRPLSGTERSEALSQLAEQVEGAPPKGSTRALTPAEVVELDAAECIEIGAHTVSHEVLAQRPVEDQRQEIVESKRALEEMCGHEIVSFAYPHGGHGDYSRDTVRLVREAGFLGAFTTRLGGAIPWGSVGHRTDRFEVPRTATVGLDATALVALVDKRLG